MRIESIEFRFLDGAQAVEGYTRPGWYVSANDAEVDNQLWAIRPVRITAEQAETFAAALAPVVGNRAVAGVKEQNRHATERAREAVVIADALARKAAARAADLAEWEGTPS